MDMSESKSDRRYVSRIEQVQEDRERVILDARASLQQQVRREIADLLDEIFTTETIVSDWDLDTGNLGDQEITATIDEGIEAVIAEVTQRDKREAQEAATRKLLQRVLCLAHLGELGDQTQQSRIEWRQLMLDIRESLTWRPSGV